jgi:hypothetical protein
VAGAHRLAEEVTQLDGRGGAPGEGADLPLAQRQRVDEASQKVAEALQHATLRNMSTLRKKRLPLTLPVSIGRKMAAISADISPDGFCLEVMTPIAPGTLIDGYVLHGEHELTFQGEVKWREAANPQASHWTRIGVRFTEVSPGLKALFSLAR